MNGQDPRPHRSAHDIAIHIAKTMSFDVSDQVEQRWLDEVAERGIELADSLGTFTVNLENGQRFVVRVEETWDGAR